MPENYNNLHRIFTARRIGFKYRIHPTDTDFKVLNEAKTKVRACLKSKMKEYLESQGIQNIVPKFRVQGSWAYGTCNLPARPGQEMDVDYGIYLPVSAFTSFNSKSESTQAKDYFAQVEKFLKELCQSEEWKLDTNKSTCIRIKIKPNAHMDVPLYAVPDNMFDSLVERNTLMLATEAAKYDSASNRVMLNEWYIQDYQLSSIDFAEDSFESLENKNITTIHMAKRDGSWQSSDCEIIREWFSNKLEMQPDNGKQLRSICRYLKAWRDWIFESGSPSSILLMIIACKHYLYNESRDDLALADVLEKLPEALAKDVYESIKEHELEDFNRMNPKEREYARKRADDLYKTFQSSLLNPNKEKIIGYMTRQWGNRIPTDTDLIEISRREDVFETAPLAQSFITSQTPLRQG